MIRILIATFLVSTIVAVSFGFAQELDTAWVRQISQFSSGQINEFTSISVDSSGDLFCAGRTNTLGLAVKIRRNGKLAWATTIAIPDYYNFYIANSTSSVLGKYYVVGHSGSMEGDPDWTICCIDTSGVLDWYRTYDLSNGLTDWAQDVVISQNSLYIAGLIGESLGRIMVMKMTFEGDTLWTRTFDPVNAILERLFSYADGSIGGVSTQEDGRYVNVFKLSPSGDLLWSRSWTDSTAVPVTYCTLGGSVVDSVGRVSILGTVYSRDPNAGLFLSYDANGELPVTQFFEIEDSSGYLEITDACLASDQTLALCCYAWDGMHVIKVSQGGVVTSNRVYGLPATYPTDIFARPNNELAIVSNHTDVLTQGDIYLHIIDNEGVLLNAQHYSEFTNVTEVPVDAAVSPDGEIVIAGRVCAASCSPLVLSYVQYMCGDADSNDLVNISDAVKIINYIFVGGPAPYPTISADVDSNGLVTISDAVYLINYIFAGGAPPCEGCP